MKINRSSFHFRAVKSVYRWPSDSLCLYFWQAVWSAIIICIALPAATLLVIFLASTPLLNIFYRHEFFFPAVISGAFEIWMLILCWIDYRKETYPPKEHKEPSIVGAYIKAKKDKVCPRLEFVD